MKFLASFLITVLLLPALACSKRTDSESSETSTSVSLPDEEPRKKMYNIEAEEIPIRTGPGTKYDKIINERATEVTRQTQYCNVDYSVGVEVLEENGKWSKIRVVEPDYLSATHVGWIPTKYIVGRQEETKKTSDKLNSADYEVFKSKQTPSVQSFHVLLKRKVADKKELHKFIEQFQQEFCTGYCKINVYDSKEIEPLIDVYPLPKTDYLKMADHLMAIYTSDSPKYRDWYPYQDFKYRDYGGKNWKKEPIK